MSSDRSSQAATGLPVTIQVALAGQVQVTHIYTDGGHNSYSRFVQAWLKVVRARNQTHPGWVKRRADPYLKSRDFQTKKKPALEPWTGEWGREK
jgi:hypothetical protein